MKSIYLVKQYTYGVTRCAKCGHVQTWRAVRKDTGADTDITLYNIRQWAAKDGWTRDRRQQMICPTCSPLETDHEKQASDE